MGQWKGHVFLGTGDLVYAGPLAPTRPHRHHAFQIMVALRGSFSLSGVNFEDGVEGTAAVVWPDCEHAISASSESVVVVFVDPQTRGGRQLRAGFEPASDPVAWFERGAALRSELTGLPPETWSEACAVARNVVERLVGPSQYPTVEHPAIKRARRYIEEGLHDDLRIAAVATAAGLSAGRMSHLFSQQVGIPLRAFVRWVRMQAAVRELERGRSLTEAAAAAGFADSAHLSRVFRDMFGITPSEVTRFATWVGPPKVD